MSFNQTTVTQEKILYLKMRCTLTVSSVGRKERNSYANIYKRKTAHGVYINRLLECKTKEAQTNRMCEILQTFDFFFLFVKPALIKDSS